MPIQRVRNIKEAYLDFGFFENFLLSGSQREFFEDFLIFNGLVNILVIKIMNFFAQNVC